MNRTTCNLVLASCEKTKAPIVYYEGRTASNKKRITPGS